MTLVDTSVLIDKLRKNENNKTALLDRLHETKSPYGISIYTFHEILQGAKFEPEFNRLYHYFSTQNIFYLPMSQTVYVESAKLCFALRRQGFATCNTIDILIAFTAIYHQLPLLHNDRDFDFIAERVPKLTIMN